VPGSIGDRLAVLRARGDLDRVSRADRLRGAFGWYGVRRRRIARALRVGRPIGGFEAVDAGAYAVAWPTGVPLDRLVTALVELRAPTNPHYYFREPTPVRPGDHVVDVGGCEGAFGLEAIVRHGAARVWCFEPGATMVAALRRTAQLNGLEGRLEVVAAAAGARSGVCQFVENAADPLSSRIDEGPAVETLPRRDGTQVPLIALDEWADAGDVERIDYLKIDAEGSDVAVLEGARAVLGRWRPRIAATTYHEPDHCERMIDLLDSLDAGYRYAVRGVVAFDGVARPVMLHATVER
jgi:FkbM family methyltransferase